MSLFFGAHEPADQELGLFAIPYEGPTNCRGGQMDGPAAVRRASTLLETYVPRLDQDFHDLGLADHGDFPIDDIPTAKKSIYLGGDHTVSELTIKAQSHKDLAVVTFDAHLDAFDVYEGSQRTHACWARRIGEHLGDNSLWFLGARAYTKEERDWARHHQRLLPLFEVDLETAALTAAHEIQDRPVYVSVDIDVLDPAYAPGVGNPEGLGATQEDLWKALAKLKNVVAFDLVEVTPRLDPSLRTALVGAELIRDFSLLWWS